MNNKLTSPTEACRAQLEINKQLGSLIRKRNTQLRAHVLEQQLGHMGDGSPVDLHYLVNCNKKQGLGFDDGLPATGVFVQTTNPGSPPQTKMVAEFSALMNQNTEKGGENSPQRVCTFRCQLACNPDAGDVFVLFTVYKFREPAWARALPPLTLNSRFVFAFQEAYLDLSQCVAIDPEAKVKNHFVMDTVIAIEHGGQTTWLLPDEDGFEERLHALGIQEYKLNRVFDGPHDRAHIIRTALAADSILKPGVAPWDENAVTRYESFLTENLAHDSEWVREWDSRHVYNETKHYGKSQHLPPYDSAHNTMGLPMYLMSGDNFAHEEELSELWEKRRSAVEALRHYPLSYEGLAYRAHERHHNNLLTALHLKEAMDASIEQHHLEMLALLRENVPVEGRSSLIFEATIAESGEMTETLSSIMGFHQYEFGRVVKKLIKPDSITNSTFEIAVRAEKEAIDAGGPSENGSSVTAILSNAPLVQVTHHFKKNEELIFMAWLLGEATHLPARALSPFSQSQVFVLAHPYKPGVDNLYQIAVVHTRGNHFAKEVAVSTTWADATLCQWIADKARVMQQLNAGHPIDLYNPGFEFEQIIFERPESQSTSTSTYKACAPAIVKTLKYVVAKDAPTNVKDDLQTIASKLTAVLAKDLAKLQHTKLRHSHASGARLDTATKLHTYARPEYLSGMAIHPCSGKLTSMGPLPGEKSGDVDFPLGNEMFIRALFGETANYPAWGQMPGRALQQMAAIREHIDSLIERGRIGDAMALSEEIGLLRGNQLLEQMGLQVQDIYKHHSGAAHVTFFVEAESRRLHALVNAKVVAAYDVFIQIAEGKLVPTNNPHYAFFTLHSIGIGES